MTSKEYSNMAMAGYKGHRKGSRKEQVRRIFDQRGPSYARRTGKQKGLRESTLRSWFSTWAHARTDQRSARVPHA